SRPADAVRSGGRADRGGGTDTGGSGGSGIGGRATLTGPTAGAVHHVAQWRGYGAARRLSANQSPVVARERAAASDVHVPREPGCERPLRAVEHVRRAARPPREVRDHHLPALRVV